MERDAREYVVAFTRAGLELFHNSEKEEDVTDDTKPEELAYEVACQYHNAEDAVEFADEAKDEHLSVDLELRCLA